MLRKINLNRGFVIFVTLILFSFNGIDAKAKSVSSAEAPSTISFNNFWARPTFGEIQSTAIYLSLINLLKTDDALISINCVDAFKSELHKIVTVEGISKMVPISKLVLPAGQVVTLKPAGMHIMLMGLKRTLAEGDEIALELTFEKARKMVLKVPVRNQ